MEGRLDEVTNLLGDNDRPMYNVRVVRCLLSHSKLHVYGVPALRQTRCMRCAHGDMAVKPQYAKSPVCSRTSMVPCQCLTHSLALTPRAE